MPLRKDLEAMCGGNQRLVKAFEKLFEVIPKELNNGSAGLEAAQMTADNAVTQAQSVSATLDGVMQQIEMAALQPRMEQITPDCIYPIYQSISCENFNLEIN